MLASSGASSSQVGQHDAETWDYSPYPAPDSGYVTDLDGLLSDEAHERIEVWLWQTESRSGIEIASRRPSRSQRDADAARVMQQSILPHFRDDDYSEGITEGVRALASEFASLRLGFPRRLVWTSGAILAGILIAISLFRNGKRGWGWVVVGFVFVALLFVFRMLQGIARHMPESSSSSWSPGGFGGGFGGGFSGGGGATGSW